jgi:hypothetical protein
MFTTHLLIPFRSRYSPQHLIVRDLFNLCDLGTRGQVPLPSKRTGKTNIFNIYVPILNILSISLWIQFWFLAVIIKYRYLYDVTYPNDSLAIFRPILSQFPTFWRRQYQHILSFLCVYFQINLLTNLCVFSFHHRIQNGSGAHPASYPMGTTGSFPGGKAAGA